MKKEYISPDMLVVTLQATQLMAGSLPEEGFDPNNPTGTTGATSGNLTRRHRINWDDEEDEDDF